MTDHKTIANRYMDLWNERAPQRRREMLAANWTTDATYVDPLMSGDGHDGVDALISGVQQRFPDFKFRICIGENRPHRATKSEVYGANVIGYRNGGGFCLIIIAGNNHCHAR